MVMGSFASYIYDHILGLNCSYLIVYIVGVHILLFTRLTTGFCFNHDNICNRN